MIVASNAAKNKHNNKICSPKCFLLIAAHQKSVFDVALLGAVNPPSVTHTMDHLAEVARILKPSGRMYLREHSSPKGTINQIFFFCRLVYNDADIDVDSYYRLVPFKFQT